MVGNDDNVSDIDDVDDKVCEVIPVDVVVACVKVVAFQAAGNDNGDGADVEGCDLMHAMEKASASDETEVVQKVVANKDVYGDFDVNEEVVAEDDVVEDIEDEVGCVDAGHVNVGSDVQDIDAEVEVDGIDDLNPLKVVDADGKVPFNT